MPDIISIAGQASPWAAFVLSLFYMYVTYKRGAKSDANSYDLKRTTVIQDAYQEVLDDLRAEITRLRNRIQSLETALENEVKKRTSVEKALFKVEQELTEVEARYQRERNGEAL